MIPNLTPWVTVFELDGETHVLKSMGTHDVNVIKRQIQQLHPDLKIVKIEKADPDDPHGHVERVATEILQKFPYQEPMTNERFQQSANAAREQRNVGTPPIPQTAVSQSQQQPPQIVRPQVMAPQPPLPNPPVVQPPKP